MIEKITIDKFYNTFIIIIYLKYNRIVQIIHQSDIFKIINYNNIEWFLINYYSF